MRDNHEGMPEFIDAFEDDAHYFVRVEMILNPESTKNSPPLITPAMEPDL